MLGILYVCLDLSALLHDGLILTEALFTVVLTLACLSSIRYLERPTYPRAAIAGIAFSFLALIKPIAAPIALGFVLCSWRSGKYALVLICFMVMLPFGWVARNWSLTGKPIYTVQGNVALFRYPAAGALAIDEGLTRVQALSEMENDLRRDQDFDHLNPVLQNKIYHDKAVAIMKAHPWATVRFCADGAVRILAGTGLEMLVDLVNPRKKTILTPESNPNPSGSGTLTLLKQYPALIPIEIAYSLMLLAGYVMCLGGIWRLARAGDVAIASFILISMGLIVAISCHQGYYRFRIPLLPFLALGVALFFSAAAGVRARATFSQY